jgi:hypothetical protein
LADERRALERRADPEERARPSPVGQRTRRPRARERREDRADERAGHERHAEARRAPADPHQRDDDDVERDRLRHLHERDLAEVEATLEHGGRNRLEGAHDERDADQAKEPRLRGRPTIERGEPRRRRERRERHHAHDRLLEREDRPVLVRRRLVGKADEARLQAGPAARPEKGEDEEHDPEHPDLGRTEQAREQRVAREVQDLRKDLPEAEEPTTPDRVTRDRRSRRLLHAGVPVSQKRDGAGRGRTGSGSDE